MPVALLDVNCTEAVYFLVSRFFLDEEVMNRFPAREYMTVLETQFGDLIDDMKDLLRFQRGRGPIKIIVGDRM